MILQLLSVSTGLDLRHLSKAHTDKTLLSCIPQLSDLRDIFFVDNYKFIRFAPVNKAVYFGESLSHTVTALRVIATKKPKKITDKLDKDIQTPVEDIRKAIEKSLLADKIVHDGCIVIEVDKWSSAFTGKEGP